MSAQSYPASELEHELTYVARFLPPELQAATPKRLVDVYIPDDAAVHPRVRLRQKGDAFEFTKKVPVVAGDASVHHEQTVTLERDEFLCLARGSLRRVEKDRFVVTIDGHRAEVDVFRGALEGLVLIDFEFSTREELEEFNAPSCCGQDVTQEDFIAGGLLAGKSYSDIESDLKRCGYEPIR